MDNIPRVIILGGERWASNVRTIASRSRACPLRHARTASNAVMRRSGPRHCARISATRIRIRELRPQPLCLSIRAARYCSSLRLPCATTRSESTNAAASAICRPGGSTCGSTIYLEAQRSNQRLITTPAKVRNFARPKLGRFGGPLTEAADRLHRPPRRLAEADHATSHPSRRACSPFPTIASCS
jgi:hypothetical protein